MPTPAPLLRRNTANPRYFADPTGRAVYLTGSHTWNNLLDKGPGNPPPPFDWDFYLDFLEKHNHNCIRLWSGQMLTPCDNPGGGVSQLPWRRTGPDKAVDGGPRFDLTAFDPAYFDRLRHRVGTAGERGIYVDVMLFEGWCATVGHAPMECHAFAGDNNINGVDILGSPREKVYARWVTLDDAEVVRLQELYVREVVRAVNAFDNVLYEIANEPSGLSHGWQEHFVDFIRACEAELGKVHPIGVPGGMKTHNRRMFASGADWVSPDIQAVDDDRREDYRKGTATWGEPDYDRGDKVVVLDTDHLWGLGGSTAWAWKSFCRGYNVFYMDPARDFPGAFFKGTAQWSNEPNLDLRREMGVIRSYAERVDLNRTLPRNDLCSTGYCLAQPGRACIAFQPEAGPFTVTVEPGRYAMEWHFVDTGDTAAAAPADLPGGTAAFEAPRAEAAALMLLRL